MRRQVLLDTGPVVAFLKRQDQFHSWITQEWATIEPPLLTCEAVISEACFLLRNVYGGKQAVISLVNSGVVQIPFRLDEEAGLINELLTRYQSVPMSLADACLVRMAEQYAESMLVKYPNLLTLRLGLPTSTKFRDGLIRRSGFPLHR